MKDKIINTKIFVIFWLVCGVLNFGVFAYDLEKDKDWLTYGWLLYAIVSFCMFIVYGVKLEILRNERDRV